MLTIVFCAEGARFHLRSDFSLRDGSVVVDGEEVLSLRDRTGAWRGHMLELRGSRPDELALWLDGAPAPREEQLRMPTSRSAWWHAFIALFASFAGFVASWLYLDRAELHADPWSLKMAIHMAGWHLLLTLTLFPASVWGQRMGIRAVQGVSLIFFFIHVGIALANTGDPSTPAIAFFNAVSGLFFLAAVVYGQRAHRDMSPVATSDR